MTTKKDFFRALKLGDIVKEYKGNDKIKVMTKAG